MYRSKFQKYQWSPNKEIVHSNTDFKGDKTVNISKRMISDFLKGTFHSPTLWLEFSSWPELYSNLKVVIAFKYFCTIFLNLSDHTYRSLDFGSIQQRFKNIIRYDRKVEKCVEIKMLWTQLIRSQQIRHSKTTYCVNKKPTKNSQLSFYDFSCLENFFK